MSVYRSTNTCSCNCKFCELDYLLTSRNEKYFDVVDNMYVADVITKNQWQQMRAQFYKN